jgi:hypothetical protein
MKQQVKMITTEYYDKLFKPAYLSFVSHKGANHLRKLTLGSKV